MVQCPMCGQRADQLNPPPPEVITSEMIVALVEIETVSDVLVCSECIHRLMDGESSTELIASGDHPAENTLHR